MHFVDLLISLGEYNQYDGKIPPKKDSKKKKKITPSKKATNKQTNPNKITEKKQRKYIEFI